MEAANGIGAIKEKGGLLPSAMILESDLRPDPSFSEARSPSEELWDPGMSGEPCITV